MVVAVTAIMARSFDFCYGKLCVGRAAPYAVTVTSAAVQCAPDSAEQLWHDVGLCDGILCACTAVEVVTTACDHRNARAWSSRHAALQLNLQVTCCDRHKVQPLAGIFSVAKMSTILHACCSCFRTPSELHLNMRHAYHIKACISHLSPLYST